MAAGDLIKILNPKLKGWGNFYKHCVASKTFGYVDSQIFKSLYRAKRRHPNKGAKWIVRKYFRSKISPEWEFQGLSVVNGSITHQSLSQMARIPIKRHIKIKSNANPFSPSYADYLERRRQRKVSRNTWIDPPFTAF